MLQNFVLLNKKTFANLTGAFGLAVSMNALTLQFAHAAKCENGKASFYGVGDGFNGKKTASGEIFNTYALTAAHRSLPFGSKVVVEGRNGRDVTVRINDRGPYHGGRIIDLSYAAAKKLGMVKAGVASVTVCRAG